MIYVEKSVKIANDKQRKVEILYMKCNKNG